MIKISCKEYVEIRKKALKEEISKFKRNPFLFIVQVGDNQASNSYIKGKKKDCEEVGIDYTHIKIPKEDATKEGLKNFLIETIKAKEDIDGVIVQLPIEGISNKKDLEEILNCIPPEKDVDGFRRDSFFKPCTPKGIMDWLDYNEVELSGKDVCVIGRSEIVGKPLVNMMIDAGATVTCCNSKTKSTELYTRNADIVIPAIGVSKYFDFSDFSDDCELIIDVGINRDENNKLCGDVDTIYFDRYLPYTYVTPVPGGVGLLTRNALLENVVTAYKLHNGE